MFAEAHTAYKLTKHGRAKAHPTNLNLPPMPPLAPLGGEGSGGEGSGGEGSEEGSGKRVRGRVEPEWTQ